MNTEIIVLTAKELNIKPNQVESVLTMLEEGNTVPFIARYRKERTGALDEDQIRTIETYYQYQVNLTKRKEDIIRLIQEKGLLTEEIKQAIHQADKLSDVEELYRPYKEKRKTKATIAKAKGLEPFSKWMLSFPKNDIYQEAKKYLSDEVKDEDDAIQGALDIIAEKISEDMKYRKFVKDMVYKRGILHTKEKKQHHDDTQVYQMYYDYKEKVNRIVSHRILAINRAEKEKVITVTIELDKEYCLDYIFKGLTKHKSSNVESYLKLAIKDGFDRLLFPSIERTIRNELTEKANEQSLKVFSSNLEKLLLQAPIKDKVVLGLDPAYRTGCKIAIVDQTGKVLHISKVFITTPKHSYEKEKQEILNLITTYHVQIIAIGNGTASRESEAFISDLIKENHLQVDYAIVSEAGASVYSASKLAKEEFPSLQVEERSAISIARRLQDPLSELVKIEPKAISVGQYQHDMPQKQLSEQLDFVCKKAVNQVGVDINTASYSLLQYVSGLNITVAKNIVKYRDENGMFESRDDIKKVSKLGTKTYQQAIGFLRILNGKIPLDATAIHPENYHQANQLLSLIDLSYLEIGTKEMEEKLNQLDREKIMEQIQVDRYTLDDMIDCLSKPNRTPRDNYPQPLLKKEILKIEDLSKGMVLEGTVRNVVDFGAFIDIGLKQDGLVHISKISKERIKHPLEKLSIGDIVTVSVIEVDEVKNRVGLSMID